MKDVEELADMARTSLDKGTRTKISALITHDVHSKDVINNVMTSSDVSDVSKFEWQSQLRFYWQVNQCCRILLICSLLLMTAIIYYSLFITDISST